jgi:hypothetical protein
VAGARGMESRRANKQKNGGAQNNPHEEKKAYERQPHARAQTMRLYTVRAHTHTHPANRQATHIKYARMVGARADTAAPWAQETPRRARHWLARGVIFKKPPLSNKTKQKKAAPPNKKTARSLPSSATQIQRGAHLQTSTGGPRLGSLLVGGCLATLTTLATLATCNPRRNHGTSERNGSRAG